MHRLDIQQCTQTPRYQPSKPKYRGGPAKLPHSLTPNLSTPSISHCLPADGELAVARAAYIKSTDIAPKHKPNNLSQQIRGSDSSIHPLIRQSRICFAVILTPDAHHPFPGALDKLSCDGLSVYFHDRKAIQHHSIVVGPNGPRCCTLYRVIGRRLGNCEAERGVR
jgi:hypothetical protein